MRFKEGSKAETIDGNIVTILDISDSMNFYKIKFKNGEETWNHYSDLRKIIRRTEKPASFKMNLALEQTLKEIAQHLNDDNYTLIESVTNHDYHEAAGKHHITLNIVLKENK